MNRASQEMLHCHNTTFNGGAEVSVFERQQARMKWQQQQQQQQLLFNENDRQVPDPFSGLIGTIKPDPGLQSGWPDFSDGCDDQFQPLMADQRILQKNSSSVLLSPKKRKTHENPKLKVVSEVHGIKEKKIKGCSQENSTDTSSKEKSKLTEAKKTDYIHVRARRGQATDSHSLAERVRREKISERMKYLQDLVPGCNKITGKAGMLDEIINYVQSLQKQVEFLSMKLATVHPRLDLDIDNLIMKEMFEVSAVGYSSDMANSSYLQLNSLLEMGINPFHSSCFNQIQPNVTWDGDLQSLYRMEFQQDPLTMPYQKFTGSYEGNNLKMEM